MGELFIGRSDDLVLAFDSLLTLVAPWEPGTVGTAMNTIVFTNKKAWLIVRPMKKELDLKFYYSEPLEHDLLKKVKFAYGKYAHHIRIKHEREVTPDLLRLLKKGYEFGMR